MAKRRDFDALQKRRMQAASLLRRGMGPREVADKLGVSRQSVMRWSRALKEDGQQALRKAPRAGRPDRLDEPQRAALIQTLKAGALAAGFGTELWTLKRVAKVIEQQSGLRYSESGVWHLLGRIGFSCQRPTGRAVERDEASIEHWKRKRWPALKKTLRAGGKP